MWSISLEARGTHPVSRFAGRSFGQKLKTFLVDASLTPINTEIFAYETELLAF